MATFAAIGKTLLVIVIAAFLYTFFWISILPFMRIKDGEIVQLSIYFLRLCVSPNMPTPFNKLLSTLQIKDQDS